MALYNGLGGRGAVGRGEREPVTSWSSPKLKTPKYTILACATTAQVGPYWASKGGVGKRSGEDGAWLTAYVQQLACMPRHVELVQGIITHGEHSPVVRIEF